MIKTERRLVPVGSPSLSYDNRGNLLSDGAYEYTWDLADRLASVEVDSSTADLTDIDRIKLAFTYDHENRRTSKTVYQWDSAANSGSGGYVVVPEEPSASLCFK